ncbi:MAG TPA: type II and III secretion system protein family protein [Candidatus Sulfotelmatobacter sp.]|jgi:pilus assembly protein CpaC|nr:type II and III secretion system protein family protein [Candidatus Sulfotelmatobacter sp.]
MSNRYTNGTKAAAAIGALCFALTWCEMSAFGQDSVAAMAPAAPPDAANVIAQQADQGPPAAATAGSSERLHLLVGRSLVISSPAPVKRVSIADPNIADAVVISPYQVLLNGRNPGGVSLVLWDESDQSQTFEIFVDLDILGLSQKIREVFPNEPVRVEASKDLVMVSGHASSKAVENQILAIVSSVNPKVVNLMEAPAAPTQGQIVLQVKFAEVDRTNLNTFGVNLFSPGSAANGPRSTVGSAGTQQFSAPNLNSLSSGNTSTSGGGGAQSLATNFTFSNLLNIFLFRPDLDLGATIEDLQQRNILQILAEPNLLTATGKEASFLAGGEFPYPVLQASSISNAVTIQFREYGVRLTFTPTIMENGQIHLKVRPEVSALDYSNAVTISGFTIPALSTRRVESEMDLNDGQSFAIAGLVDDRVTRILSKVPGISDIPVLGKLFQSTSFTKSKTELLVLVTPRIVKPFSPGETPAGPQFPVPFLPPAAPDGSTQPTAKP